MNTRILDFLKVFGVSTGALSDFPTTSFFCTMNPGIVPSSYSNNFKDPVSVDLSNEDIAKIKVQFPNAGFAFFTNEYEDDEDSEPRSGFFVYDDGWCSSVYPGWMNIVYDNKRVNCKHVYDVISSVLEKKEETFMKKVSVIGFAGGTYFTTSAKIRQMEMDLGAQYNDDIIEMDKKMQSFLKEKSSGLCILHGDPGTGKTSYIRHIINTTNKSFVIIPPSVGRAMTDPAFTEFLLDEKDSIFILEDCEELIESRDTDSPIGAVSDILNMTDGLLSDIFNIKFICTFNASTADIDQALLRKGRCIINYEFKPLCEEKSAALLDKLGFDGSKCDGPMTLADIYNFNDNDHTKKSKKIGF